MTREKTEPQERRHSNLSPNWHITEQESHTPLGVISKSSGMRAVRTIKTRTIIITTITKKNMYAWNCSRKCKWGIKN